MEKRNRLRQERFSEEMRKMRQLDVKRLVEYDEIRRRVTRGSTVSVKKNSYSVPSRLIGEEVLIRISERKLEVRYKGALQLNCHPWRWISKNITIC